MATPDPRDGDPSEQPRDPPAGDEPPTAPEVRKRRNPWVWVSVLLAVVSVGLLVWALTVKSDSDSTQAELDSTQKELADTKAKLGTTTQQLDSAEKDAEELQSASGGEDRRGGRALLAAGAFATAKSLYDDLAQQLGTTQDDLDAVEQDLQAATDKADKAEQDAKAAEKRATEADDETDVAKAEADQAEAELQAAESKAAVATDCAKAYVSAFGTLFEGDSVRDQAAAVRKQLASITTDCKAAFAG